VLRGSQQLQDTIEQALLNLTHSSIVRSFQHRGARPFSRH